MSYDNEIFANKLKKCRSKKKLTQEELAEICGVSRQAVAKWEAGRSIPDVLGLKTLAQLFEVSVDYLLDLENYSPEEKSKELILFRIVNNILKEAVTRENPEAVMSSLVEYIGKNFCTDRCYLLEKSCACGCVKKVFEWCSAGVSPIDNNLGWVFRCLEKYKKYEDSIILDIEALRESELEAYEILKKHKTKVIVLLSINGDDLFFGLDNPSVTSISSLHSALDLLKPFIKGLLNHRNVFNKIELNNFRNELWDRFHRIGRCIVNIEEDTVDNISNVGYLLGYDSELDVFSCSELLKFFENNNFYIDDIIDTVSRTKECLTRTMPFLSPKKGLLWFELTVCPFVADNKKAMKIYITFQDVTQKHNALMLYKALSSFSPGGAYIYCLSEPTHLLYFSDSLCSLLEYTPEEFENLIGKNYTNIIVEEQRTKFENYVISASNTICNIECVYSVRTKNGKILKLLDTMQVKKDADGSIFGYANVVNITELEKGFELSRSRKESIQKSIYTDSFTGFANKWAFKKSVEKLLPTDNIGVLICHVKNNNNDFYTGGKEQKDNDINLLKSLFLKSFSRDVIYRIDTEEFAVLIVGATPESLKPRMEAFANKSEVKELACVGFAMGKGEDYNDIFATAEGQMFKSYHEYLHCFL